MPRKKLIQSSRKCQSSVSRRTLLKVMAGSPLVITLSMLVSPLTRILKPTTGAGNIFQSPDLPVPERVIEFKLSDFPTDYYSQSFDFHMKYKVFNPEQEEIKITPGIAVRLSADEIVAYSLNCPTGRGCTLNYKTEMCCGCVKSTIGSCACERKRIYPVLVCPKHHSTFDLMREACIVSGLAPRPPLRFQVIQQGNMITINDLEGQIS